MGIFFGMVMGGPSSGGDRAKMKIAIVDLDQSTLSAKFISLLGSNESIELIETNLKPFDIVPLISIIEKAGGVVSTWDNQSAIKGGNILATSNKKLHSIILKILNSYKA